MTYSYFDDYTSKPVTVSLGFWSAQVLGNSARTGVTTGNFQNITTFTNTQLLQLLQNAYPGLSRQISFNPTGLGIGTTFNDPNTGTGVFGYPATKVIEPDNYDHDSDGSLSHVFTARGTFDRSNADSDAYFGGVSYLDWGFYPTPGTMGVGGEAVVSQPIKSNDRIYFEVHVDSVPTLMDASLSTPPAIDYVGRHDRSGNDGHGSGGLQMTIAPENWLSSGMDAGAQGRAFSIDLVSKLLMISGDDRTGANEDLITFNGSNQGTLYRTNVSVDSNGDTGNIIQSGDVLMIAIDGVSDSSGENRLFWGLNGTWAKADSADTDNFGKKASHSSYDPGDDSVGVGGAFRPGVSLTGTEDPYYLYFSPIWSDSSVSDNASDDFKSSYAVQADRAGAYPKMKFGVTIKGGNDVTYSPPTSGRGTFRAH